MDRSRPNRSVSQASWAPVVFWLSVVCLFMLLAGVEEVGAVLANAGFEITAGRLGVVLLGSLAPVGLIAYYVALRKPRRAAVGRLPAAWPLIEQAATVGLAGYAPWAPGTLGALIAIPIGISIAEVPWMAQALGVAGGTVAAGWLVHKYVKHAVDDDPKEVVLDELFGCLITLLFVPARAAWLAAAFVLFRLLDILKPWPIGPVDRRLKGGVGVMGDDVVAGLLAGGLLAGVRHLGLVQGWWG